MTFWIQKYFWFSKIYIEFGNEIYIKWGRKNWIQQLVFRLISFLLKCRLNTLPISHSSIAVWNIFIRATCTANNLRPSKRNSIQCCPPASLLFPWTRGCSTNQYTEHPLTDATPSFPAGAEERRATITDTHS